MKLLIETLDVYGTCAVDAKDVLHTISSMCDNSFNYVASLCRQNQNLRYD